MTKNLHKSEQPSQEWTKDVVCNIEMWLFVIIPMYTSPLMKENVLWLSLKSLILLAYYIYLLPEILLMKGNKNKSAPNAKCQFIGFLENCNFYRIKKITWTIFVNIFCRYFFINLKKILHLSFLFLFFAEPHLSIFLYLFTPFAV
jgi:hypothetical protein